MFLYIYELLTSYFWGYIFNFILWTTFFVIVIRSNIVNRFLYKRLFNADWDKKEIVPVAVLIPARDEPELVHTLKSVCEQTCSPEHVIVVLNNYVDLKNAKQQVNDLFLNYKIPYEILEMKENIYYKSGALNYGMRWIIEHLTVKYICQMDSDSELDKHFLEYTCQGMSSDNKIGALSSSFEGKKKLLSRNKVLYFLQNIEYIKYHHCQILEEVNVISGTGNLIRVSALQNVKKEFGHFWDIYSLVEDYALTLNLKKLDYKVFKSTEYVVYTDLMPNIKDLWQQRIRWQRGTFQELFKRKINKKIWSDYLKEIRFFIFSILEYFVYFVLAWGTISNKTNVNGFMFILSPIIATTLYHSYFLRKGNIYQRILCILFIPLFFYGMLRFLWWFYSLMTFRRRRWTK